MNGKHGTCYSDSPEEYFQESIALLDQVNNSSVRDLFARNISNFLSSNEIRNQFDEAFNNGAGSKVQVQCEKDIDEDRNNMVVELQVNLKGDIQPDTPIATLLQNGRTVPAGCAVGEIDPAGFTNHVLDLAFSARKRLPSILRTEQVILSLQISRIPCLLSVE